MRLIQALACAALLAAGSTAHAQKIKVGYWTSGFSLGFGVVMEQLKFAEKEGLDVEWVKFAEVNGPTRAIRTADHRPRVCRTFHRIDEHRRRRRAGENRARHADCRSADRRAGRLADQKHCRPEGQKSRHVAARQRDPCHRQLGVRDELWPETHATTASSPATKAGSRSSCSRRKSTPPRSARSPSRR